MDVYWFDDQRGVRLPKACRLKYWDGNAFVAVPGATGLGLAAREFNTTEFPEITTTRLRLEQVTDYPWSGNVAITVTPAEAKRFSIRIRVPNRNVSKLYAASPACDGLASLAVNGKPLTAIPNYARLNRGGRSIVWIKDQ
jgi:hypothetical protein